MGSFDGSGFPQLRQAVLDCTDARALAEFYRQLLGLWYRPGDEPPARGDSDSAGPDWLVLRDTSGTARLAFQQVAHLSKVTWPEGPIPQQLHLDLTVPTVQDLNDQHERALGLGARLLRDRANDPEEPLRVYADPAGHPFCIFVAGSVPTAQADAMTTKIQITFDCADPDRLAHFWAGALGYKLEDPPAGFDSWKAYWRKVGVPEEELEEGNDSVVDPAGIGPRIRFQKVPEGKVVKNRLHLDLTVSGGRGEPLAVRRQRVNAEADRLVRIGATRVRVLEQEGLDHYAMAMKDPEGNEFDIN